MKKFSVEAPNGAKLTFATANHLRTFIQEELVAWAWIDQFNGHAVVNHVGNGLIAPLRSSQIAASNDPDAPEIQSYLQQYTSFADYLLPGTKARRAIDDISTGNPVRAAYLLADFLLMRGSIGDHGQFLAQPFEWHAAKVIAVATDAGWPISAPTKKLVEVAEIEAKRLAEVLSESKVAQSDLLQLAESSSKDEAERIIARNQFDERAREVFDSLVKEFRQKFDGSSEHFTRELATFQNQVSARLALRAPASYWSVKLKNHRSWAAALGGACFLVAVFGALVVREVAHGAFGEMEITQVPTWFQAISFSLSALIYILVLRALLRYTASHVHLALDAGERHTMIASYLAIAGRSDVSKESLDNILATIFRPSGDGIVKEEVIPASALTEIFKSGR